MVVTNDVYLPPDEELTVPEVNLSSPYLQAGAFHLGKQCEFQNNEFVLCRNELEDPRACIQEGKAVTSCALDFFRKMKKSCAAEFHQYANCLDKSSGDLAMRYCRKTQMALDKCAFDNYGMERPEYDYFAKPKIHDSKRPKPEPEPMQVFPDATPEIPKDLEKPPAKYGSRFVFLE
uniref:NADH dehydrogenase [ubiquinone] 1 alpha subcomplex subunit 8 n=1 Tax=Xenopsylla cheopis TaxID=163159 RepID=A0A6M2DI53_XENCH